MGTTKTLAAVVLLCLIVVSVALYSSQFEQSSGQRWISDPALTPDSTVKRSHADPDAHSILGTDRVSLPVGSGDKTTGVLATADRDIDLYGRVVDSSGETIAAARLTVTRDILREFRRLHSTISLDPIFVAEVETDASGEFAIPLEPGRGYTLSVEADGFAGTVRFDRYAGEFVELRLNKESIFTGQIIGVGNNQGIPARVRGRRIGDESRFIFDVRTDDNGSFRIAGLDAMEILVEAIPDRAAPPRAMTLRTIPGRTHQVDLVCGSGFTLRGKITDAITGEPIFGAEVSNYSSFNPTAKTNRRGRYRLGQYTAAAQDVLEVRAAGYGTVKRVSRNAYRPPSDLDFELHAGRHAYGRLVDSSGRPVEAACVVAIGSKLDNAYHETAFHTARTTSSGRYQFSNLSPHLSHSILVLSEEYATVVYDLPDGKIRQSQFLGEIELQPPTLLRGSLVRSNGAMLADHEIRLLGANRDRDLLGGVRSEGIDRICAERIGRSDNRGRFAFSHLAPGEYQLTVAKTYFGKPFVSDVLVTGLERVQEVLMQVDW